MRPAAVWNLDTRPLMPALPPSMDISKMHLALRFALRLSKQCHQTDWHPVPSFASFDTVLELRLILKLLICRSARDRSIAQSKALFAALGRDAGPCCRRAYKHGHRQGGLRDVGGTDAP